MRENNSVAPTIFDPSLKKTANDFNRKNIESTETEGRFKILKYL